MIEDVRLNVRVTKTLRKAVERQAERDGRTVSDVVREFLQNYAGVDDSIKPIRPKRAA